MLVKNVPENAQDPGLDPRHGSNDIHKISININLLVSEGRVIFPDRSNTCPIDILNIKPAALQTAFDILNINCGQRAVNCSKHTTKHPKFTPSTQPHEYNSLSTQLSTWSRPEVLYPNH
jgi:hypothetical protein